jgi:ribosomal protein S18 acetylase RimI-like enzyme
MDTSITVERVPFASLGEEWHELVRGGYHADYAGIFELYDEVGTAEDKIDRMRRWGGGIMAWTAREAGRLAGILTGNLDGDRLTIYDFFVAVTHRRRGIGRALLGAALAEPGLRQAAAEINTGNTASRGLFEALGFQRAAGIDWYAWPVAPTDSDRPTDPAISHSVSIRPMTLDDYHAVMALMSGTPGIAVRVADSPAAIARYLARNPGLSLVAEGEGGLIGCVFCGHDGRRGYLHHVVVAAGQRGQGIGRALVARALDGLAAQGIYKTHLDVFADNDAAIAFWQATGWQRRGDIVRFSYNRSADPNI